MTDNRNTIWQYWETKETKPLFVDGLHEIAKRNSGAKVIQVTPETLSTFLPNMPKEVLKIEEIAHKTDMIRAMLLFEYGGMWLDSDAIVLKDLSCFFEMLEQYEFVGFITPGPFGNYPGLITNAVFFSRPKSKILSEYIDAQHSKFPKVKYHWTEIGIPLLTEFCFKYKDRLKTIPDRLVYPIRWHEIGKFNSPWIDSREMLEKSYIVQLSNHVIGEKNPRLARGTIEEMSSGHDLIADIINKAFDPNYIPPSVFRKTTFSLLTSSKLYYYFSWKLYKFIKSSLFLVFLKPLKPIFRHSRSEWIRKVFKWIKGIEQSIRCLL